MYQRAGDVTDFGPRRLPKNRLHEALAFVNYAHRLTFFRYLIGQIIWMTVTEESQQEAFIREKLSSDWNQMDHELEQLWCTAFS